MSDKKRGNNRRFRPNQNRNPQERQQKSEPVSSINSNYVCARCGQKIVDLASSISDKQTGEPLHFDCILDFLQKTETLEQNQKITYIGQGRFGVVYFENPHDTRRFKIVKIIEWEERDKKADWRNEIASQFSQVK